MKKKLSDQFFKKEDLKDIFSSKKSYEQDKLNIEKSIANLQLNNEIEISLRDSNKRLEIIKNEIESSLLTISYAVTGGIAKISNKQNDFLMLVSDVHAKIDLMNRYNLDELFIKNKDGNTEIFTPFSESLSFDRNLYGYNVKGEIYKLGSRVKDFTKDSIKASAQNLLDYIEQEKSNPEIQKFSETIIAPENLQFIKNICNNLIIKEDETKGGAVAPKSFIQRLKSGGSGFNLFK